MATNAASGAARQLKSARRTIDVWKKYTVQSHGIWEKLRRLLAVDPSRSNGIPLNLQYRNPPPGANPPEAYDDPVTLPAGDLAENAYFKRDARRNYPTLSVMSQSNITGLLASQKAKEVQAIDAPTSSSIKDTTGPLAIEQSKQSPGLSTYLRTSHGLAPPRLPPSPVGMNRQATHGGKGYTLTETGQQGFPEEYPCRTFV